MGLDVLDGVYTQGPPIDGDEVAAPKVTTLPDRRDNGVLAGARTVLVPRPPRHVVTLVALPSVAVVGDGTFRPVPVTPFCVGPPVSTTGVTPRPARQDGHRRHLSSGRLPKDLLSGSVALFRPSGAVNMLPPEPCQKIDASSSRHTLKTAPTSLRVAGAYPDTRDAIPTLVFDVRVVVVIVAPRPRLDGDGVAIPFRVAGSLPSLRLQGRVAFLRPLP